MSQQNIQLSYLNKGNWKNFSNQVKTVMDGIRIKTNGNSAYYLQYRTMNQGMKNYYPYVKSNENDYAGFKGKPIQRLQIQVYKNDGTKLVSGIVVMYRAFVDNKWLPWVSNADPEWMRSVQKKYKLGGTLDTGSSYAGLPNKKISGIEIRIYEEGSLETFSGGELNEKLSYMVGNKWKTFEKGAISTKMDGIKISTSTNKDYYLLYKTWNEGCASYYPEVKSTGNDYAGYPNKAIQRLSISAYKKNGTKLSSGIIVMYRVYVNETWLPWVSNADPEWMRNVQIKYGLDGTLDTGASYAGINGKNIKGVEIRIFEEDSLNSGSGTFDGSEVNLLTQYMVKNTSNWKRFNKKIMASRIEGIKIQTGSNTSFILRYKTWNMGRSSYYPEVTSKENDYAGYPQKPIQRLSISVYSENGTRITSDIVVMYRAYVEGRWLPWVSNADPEWMRNVQCHYNLGGTLDFTSSYAGIHGKNIGGIEIRAFKGKSSSESIGNLIGKEEAVKLAYIDSGSLWHSFYTSICTGKIDGIRIWTDPAKPYYLLYRTWNAGKSCYYPYVKSTENEYAGYPGGRIQLLNIQVYRKDGIKVTTGVVVMYRVYTEGRWLPWVSNADPEWMRSVQSKYNLDGSLDTSAYYAGIKGKNIAGVEIHIYEETSLYTEPSVPVGKNKIIQAPFISQLDKYPTGCESVTAVMALKYIGINISVDTFIDNYLSKSGVPFDPNLTFGGNPKLTSGYGCYAPVIKKALDKILSNKNYKAELLRNISIKTLCSQYIDKNIPVIIWATMYMNKSRIGATWEFNGKEIKWIVPEHCLLLVGYDEKHYIFNDPLQLKAQTYYTKTSVEEAYKGLYTQAIVLVKKEPSTESGLSSQKLSVFKQLYDLAYGYLESIKVPQAGIVPNVYDANKIVLAYLRQGTNYDGRDWATIAGPIDSGFNTLVKEKYPKLVNRNITLIDPVSNKNIEITHFAATLGALVNYIIAIETFMGPYIDAFAGWAGDLLQVGGVLDASYNLGSLNHLTDQNALYKCIGTLDRELDKYNIYEKNKKGKIIIKHSAGFDYMDLVQDVDTFNMAKMYSFYTFPLYSVLDKYYNKDKIPKVRYSKFEENLLKEFGTASLYETALQFTQLQKLPAKALNLVFESNFGSFDHEAYGENLAKAFASKILDLKKREK